MFFQSDSQHGAACSLVEESFSLIHVRNQTIHLEIIMNLQMILKIAVSLRILILCFIIEDFGGPV